MNIRQEQEFWRQTRILVPESSWNISKFGMSRTEDIERQKGKLIMMQIVNFNPDVTALYLYYVLYCMRRSERLICTFLKLFDL
jgi:hypothetical protein